jgi:hypothetical protein
LGIGEVIFKVTAKVFATRQSVMRLEDRKQVTYEAGFAAAMLKAACPVYEAVRKDPVRAVSYR